MRHRFHWNSKIISAASACLVLSISLFPGPAHADLDGAYPCYSEMRHFEPEKAEYAKKLKEQLGYFDKRAKTEPADSLPYGRVADFYIANLKFKEADAILARGLAVKMDSKSDRADLLLKKAQLCRYRLEIPQALNLASSSLKLMLSDSYEYRDALANSLMLIGDMQASLSKFDDAQKSYDKAWTYAMPYAGETTSICRFFERKGNFLYSHRQDALAIAAFQASLQKRKGANEGEMSDANDWRSLIEIYRRQNKIANAAPYIEALWKVCSNYRDRAHPDKSAAALLMAELSIARKDTASACGYLWKAYRLYGLRFGIYGDDCLAVLKLAKSASALNASAAKWNKITEYFEPEDKLLSQSADAGLNDGDFQKAIAATSPDAKASPAQRSAMEIENLNIEATVNLIRGKLQDAEKNLVAARTKSTALWGAESSYTAMQSLRLGQVYMLSGKPGQAEPLFKSADTIIAADLGANSQEYTDCLTCLRQLYRAQNRLPEAQICQQKVLQIAQKNINDPRYARELESLADLERALGKPRDAALNYRRALMFDSKEDITDPVFRISLKLASMETPRH